VEYVAPGRRGQPLRDSKQSAGVAPSTESDELIVAQICTGTQDHGLLHGYASVRIWLANYGSCSHVGMRGQTSQPRLATTWNRMHSSCVLDQLHVSSAAQPSIVYKLVDVSQRVHAVIEEGLGRAKPNVPRVKLFSDR
jgi:hypothetical protein